MCGEEGGPCSRWDPMSCIPNGSRTAAMDGGGAPHTWPGHLNSGYRGATGLVCEEPAPSSPPTHRRPLPASRTAALRSPASLSPSILTFADVEILGLETSRALIGCRQPGLKVTGCLRCSAPQSGMCEVSRIPPPPPPCPPMAARTPLHRRPGGGAPPLHPTPVNEGKGRGLSLAAAIYSMGIVQEVTTPP